jgi:hypothetical protein
MREHGTWLLFLQRMCLAFSVFFAVIIAIEGYYSRRCCSLAESKYSLEKRSKRVLN